MKYFIIFLFLFFIIPVFVFGVEKIDINTASLGELDQLAGIGPKYAQAIIDARPFSSVDDLLRVKGIGEKTLQKIKDQGLACVDCAAPSLRGVSETSNEAIPDQNNSSTGEIASSPQSSEGAPRNDEPKNYPGGVFFNEILPNPKGNDEIDEFIKLYNSNDFEADLSGWEIEDTSGIVTNFIIPQNTKILPRDYLIFKRPETKIMLNNDGDGLNLLWPNGKIEDSVSFENAPLGISYVKTSSGWKWNQPAKTKLAQKNLKSAPLPSPEVLPATSALIAAASESLPKEEKTVNMALYLFFAALAISIISATGILLIKLKTKTNVRT